MPQGVEGMLMSPMMEKKGEKWSYTFTVPGSYHFHCHPHEELSMQGVIVVGAASVPAETRKMEHKHMHGS
ncbi:plastocyanin [compost metagenome]